VPNAQKSLKQPSGGLKRLYYTVFLPVLEQVELNLLSLKFILEAGHHSYSELAFQKIYQFKALRNFSIINNSFSGI
jgi:hypothetical protein